MLTPGQLFAPTLPAPAQAGAYSVIYVDPPWPERGGGKIKRGADKHYPVMDVRAIVEMFRTFGDWAALDAHMYCWATNNYLPDAFTCLRASKFRYVTNVTWVKNRPGLGQYFRGRTEHCLFGVRGRLPYLRRADGLRAQGQTVIYEPCELPDALPDAFEAPVPTDSAGRRIHSRKPEKMRDFIQDVSGEGPRLEIFARLATSGWDTWGNQAPGESL